MPKHKLKNPMSSREWLLRRIELHMVKGGMSPEAFGWASVKDATLVPRLRAGKDVTTRKMDAIIAYMANPTINKGE